MELWKSDGTPEGTVLVTDIYSGSGSSNPRNLINMNGTLFFSASNRTFGTELWKNNYIEEEEVPENNQEITAFPNPTSGKLKFTGKNIEGSDLYLFDSTGRVMTTQKLNGKEMDISYLQDGLYFILIINTDGSFGIKIFKN